MSIKAFIDRGYADPRTFSEMLLDSPEFLSGTLKKFADYGTNKRAMAVHIANQLEYEKVNAEKLLLEYAKQTRQWFTYKMGEYKDIPNLNDPTELLFKFGEERWYGPIYCDEEEVYYFLRVHKITHYEKEDPQSTEIKEHRIRWMLLARIDENNISFYWNGFTTNQEDRIDVNSQFPFWLHVPQAIGEMEKLLGGKYKYPLINKIVLEGMWDQYAQDPDYDWRHLAVRAEASGVNLNARSKGVQEIRVEGLLALAEAIAKSLIEDLLPKVNQSKKKRLLARAENSIMRTLIHEWGTKSYEFSLDLEQDKIFKAHCYFGSKPQSMTQDRFPHFKTFKKYGGPFKALQFLLSETSN